MKAAELDFERRKGISSRGETIMQRDLRKEAHHHAAHVLILILRPQSQMETVEEHS